MKRRSFMAMLAGAPLVPLLGSSSVLQTKRAMSAKQTKRAMSAKQTKRAMSAKQTERVVRYGTDRAFTHGELSPAFVRQYSMNVEELYREKRRGRNI